MRIGFISTRLNGTDGVSLEVEKWSCVFQRMGHEIYYCAGELGGYASEGTLIPKLNFAHQSIIRISQRAFGENRAEDGDALSDEIYEIADEIRAPLRSFIRANKLDLIVVQNALTIPMNLPLGVSLTGLIAELGIATIAHHHDFFWERERYQTNAILNLLDTTFPAKLPSIQHVTINSIAQKRLKARRDIDSIVIPNVMDYANEPVHFDEFNQDLRSVLGLSDNDLFILQPTRVIQRKGIELSIELVRNMGLPSSRLYITHSTTDEGVTYWNWLKREASIMGVELNLIDHIVGKQRKQTNGNKLYSLWDVYPHANLVTYPSLYEGFGNALLEAVLYKRLVLVNRYPVYNADIKPLGFKFIELDGYVDDNAVNLTKDLINDQVRREKFTEHNYAIAQEYFSLEVLERKLSSLIESM